jgi:hypothetical protein
MISKMIRIAGLIILASLVRPVAGATCSNASLSGTYGFLHDSTDSSGTPNSAAVTQITFDSTNGTFTGETTTSRDGVISTLPLSGTYAVASNCTGTGTPSGASPFSIVVTPAGFLALHLLAEGFAVKQGSPTCNSAGVKGSFAFEATGAYVAGAPATGAVDFIGELKFKINPSGEGEITGHLASSEDGTYQTFADEPVTGSYTVDKNCMGTATITPKGLPEMHFSFVVVDWGRELLAVETDADTIVSGTLVKRDEDQDQLATVSNDEKHGVVSATNQPMRDSSTQEKI